MTYGTTGTIATPELLAAAGPGIDAFSYHHYGAASQRCADMDMPQTTANDALSEDWLGRTSQTRAYYSDLRDRYAPGKPLWVTEVADAACGGNPWAATFLDSFRYLDQLGRLAKMGAQVVIHNTLAATALTRMPGRLTGSCAKLGCSFGTTRSAMTAESPPIASLQARRPIPAG
jgi:hypothetical protein